MPFDFSQIFSPDFVTRAAQMMDPNALMGLLQNIPGLPGTVPGGNEQALGPGSTGLKMPTDMAAAAGPYASMLAPQGGDGSGVGLRPPTREAATLVPPNGTPGVGLAGYSPQTQPASPLLPGLSAEQLRMLAMAQQQPQQPAVPMVSAPLPGRGGALPQPMQMGMPGQPVPRPTMSQLLYGR